MFLKVNSEEHGCVLLPVKYAQCCFLPAVCVCVCVRVCVQFSATPEMNYSVTVSLVSGVGLGELSDLDKSRRPARG